MSLSIFILAAMNYKDIAERIIALKNRDLAFRDTLVKKGTLGEGYNKEMEALHNSNSNLLNEIIDTIGYPTFENVGKEANEAAWLIIQHSIGQPVFMQKCQKLLKKAVAQRQADPVNLAYLTDRIAVLKGEPQVYGTQFDWDDKGELSAHPVDNLEKVNNRRSALGLLSLEEQTRIIRREAVKENHYPPSDLEKRKKEMMQWKKKVGWIK